MLLNLKALLSVEKLKAAWPIVTLLIISVFLAAVNYTPGTYLSGWDTLHPEFNFGLNFERTINGVFRVEQGLGAVAAHSHMADLPRIVILYLMHFILPQSFLRYFYIDLCFVLGPIGMYFLLYKHFLKKRSASFLSALFYMLNLGTIQTFNVPFEMFTTLFATLPFVFYYSLSYFFGIKNRNKNLLLFAIFMLFTAPAAYAATLWYIFFFLFTLFFFLHAILNRKHDKHSLKRFFNLVLVSLAVNLFWLLPSLYFIVTHGTEVAKANINLLFSDQAFLKNKEFGNIIDILFLKSFYFDWKIYASNNQFVDLLLPFINNLKNILVLTIGGFFALAIIIGADFNIAKQKIKSIPTFVVVLFCLLFLFNDNLPFSPIYDIFQNYVPFFKESLRFPDDKILNVFVFFVSIFVGYFMLFIQERLKNAPRIIKPRAILVLFVSLLIIFYALPAFKGNLINPYMRVSIPKQYFDLFKYLNTQPDTLRVSNFPINSPYGWAYYDWSSIRKGPSFQGAGFLYFGIKQPLLDRDFDRWSPYNESYYREVSYAIYSENAKLLTSVLKKYKIGFIFIDKSVINPQGAFQSLYFKQSENLLEKSGLIVQKLNFGTIDLYKLNSGADLTYSVSTINNVQPTTTSTYEDFAYYNLGDYISFKGSSKLNNTLYPFRDLINNQSKVHPNIISEDANNIILTPLNHASSFETGQILDSLKSVITDVIAKQTDTSLSLTFNPNVPVLNTLPLSFTQSLVLNTPQSSNNLLLSVNAKETIDIKNLTKNTPLLIGKAILENGTNNFSVFDTNNTIEVANTASKINPFFSSCDPTQAGPTAGILTNGLKLTGLGDVCILIPLNFLPVNQTQQTLLSGFQFNFQGSANLSSCLYNLQTASCETYKNPQIITPNLFSFMFPLFTKDINKFALKIIIKPNSLGQNSYLLTNINSWYSLPVSEKTVDQNFIKNMFVGNKTVTFDKLIFPKNNVYNPEIELTKTHLMNDCKANNAKKEIIDVNNVKTIKYTSLDGSFCDYFSYPNLPHNQGYLIAVSSQNLDGLPLTVCISNYTSRKCDIYANLDRFKNLDKDYFLLPPTDENGVGYDFNIENLGIKGTKSVNYLSSIEIMPIPYAFISNIKSSKITQNNNSSEAKITKNYTLGPDLTIITVNKPTVLTLNQSFENGFQAYRIACNSSISCLTKAILAPIISSRLQDHVLVDNWANGWIVNSNTLNNIDTKIAIIYIPQILEYLGFVALLLTFILLFYFQRAQK